MNCPEISLKCPENPDKSTRTDTRARIRNPDIVRPDFRPALPCPVSGFCPDEILSKAETLLQGGGLTPWQRAFVVGCRRHVDAGRSLSEKQAGVLHRLLDIASDAEASPALNIAPARAFAGGEHGC